MSEFVTASESRTVTAHGIFNNNVKKSLADDVNKTIQMHVVITLVVDKVGLIIVLNNLRISRVNNMTPITGENAVIFKFVGSPGKR